MLTLVSILGPLSWLAACGASHTSGSTTASNAAAAALVRTANCMLWNVIDPSERRRLVAGLRVFFGQRLDTGARTRVPSDEHAYRLLTSYCRLPFARAFLLYRLYGNAAAFNSQRR
jgi:hypothetical protein